MKKTAEKPKLPSLVKACRCRGKSTGRAVPPKGWTKPVPLAVGMLFGFPIELRCDRCGKKWKKPGRKR